MDREPHESYIFYGGPIPRDEAEARKCSEEEKEPARVSVGVFREEPANKPVPKRKKRFHFDSIYIIAVIGIFEIATMLCALYKLSGYLGFILGLLLCIFGGWLTSLFTRRE